MTGPISREALGITLHHEHLFFDLSPYWIAPSDPGWEDAPIAIDRLADIRAEPFGFRKNLIVSDPALVVQELKKFGTWGGATIVDATPQRLGRRPQHLQRLSAESGVQIVTGCGWYVHRFHPGDLAERSVSELAAEIERDLRDGIPGTDVRAGVIGEIGAETFPMHATEQMVLEAAALAQRRTGAAIIAHPAPNSVASVFELVDVLDRGGADLSRVVISHLDVRLRDDFAAYLQIARRGVFLGFDTFGRELYWQKSGRQHPSDTDRVDAIAALAARGFTPQILLSHDVCFRHELTRYGGGGWAHILRAVVPRLRTRGFDDGEMRRLLVENPANLLCGEDSGR